MPPPAIKTFGFLLFFIGLMMWGAGYTTLLDVDVHGNEISQPLFYGFIAGALIIAGVIAISIYDLSVIIYEKRSKIYRPDIPKFGVILLFVGLIMWGVGYTSISHDQTETNEKFESVFYGFIAGALIIASVIVISIHHISLMIYEKRIEEKL